MRIKSRKVYGNISSFYCSSFVKFSASELPMTVIDIKQLKMKETRIIFVYLAEI